MTDTDRASTVDERASTQVAALAGDDPTTTLNGANETGDFTSPIARLADPKQPIEGIHVLRGVAAVMVVVHHARLSVPGSDAWPSFGASGVDIFFIISGYVMMLTTQGSIGPGKFLLKRIARIVPLYWLATIWTARRVPPDLDLVKDGFSSPTITTTSPTGSRRCSSRGGRSITRCCFT